jgi:UV DNA damage repair endonuclease
MVNFQPNQNVLFLLLDFHHDDIYKSTNDIEYYFDRVFDVWNKRNIKPKVHVSNSVPGILKTDSKTARRKHSDYIQFIHSALYNVKFPIDIMLECKMKEQSIFQLRNPDTLNVDHVGGQGTLNVDHVGGQGTLNVDTLPSQSSSLVKVHVSGLGHVGGQG